jgi:hypothetical protein
MTAMEGTMHGSFLPQDDPDAAPACSRDTLGFEGTSVSGLPVRR